MSTHRLVASQLIPRPLDEVVPFFEDPQNLGRLTPSSMGFEFLTDDFEMREGLEVRYRIRPLLGIPATWATLITQADAPRGFVDIQSKGPYRFWQHRHRFEPVEGGTLVHDDIEYRLPFGPLGDLAHALVVRRQLEWIVRYRMAAVRSIFAPAGPPTRRTVAVAGGTGFVGGGIAVELHRRGYRVVVLSRSDGRAAPLPLGTEVRQADVTTGEGLDEALRGVDAVVIALAFENLPIEAPRKHQTFMEVDAGGTERVVAAADAAGVKQVVYLSGAGAAPDADRHWFRAKWRAEEAVRGSAMTWTIIRPTWIYGPRDVALNRFLGFARQLLSVPMTNFGRQRLAPVFIDDVGGLVADSLASEAAANQVFELGGPDALPMREIIATALRAAGMRRPLIPGPTPLIKLVAIPLSWLPSPILSPDAVDFINQPAVVDTKPLLERMPRRLTSLDDGVRTYLGPNARDASLSIDGRAVVVRSAGGRPTNDL